MTTATENTPKEATAKDTPEAKVADKQEAKTAENSEEILEVENVSCCGSCS